VEVVGTANGLTIGGIDEDSGVLTFPVSVTDVASNRAAVLAGSPYSLVATFPTTAGQSLQKTFILLVDEVANSIHVEDGSGVADADAYGTLSDCDAYHSRMGNTDWTGNAWERGGKLRRGTRYVEERFRRLLKGSKVAGDQALVWPRLDVDDEDDFEVASTAVPQRWIDATFEAARIVPTNWQIERGASIERVKAGSVEVEFAGSGRLQKTVDDLIWDLVAPYLNLRASAVGRGPAW